MGEIYPQAEISKTTATALAHTAAMNFDLSAAQSFMASHARVLDRRRLELLRDGPAVVAAPGDGGAGVGLRQRLQHPAQRGQVFDAPQLLPCVVQPPAQLREPQPRQQAERDGDQHGEQEELVGIAEALHQQNGRGQQPAHAKKPVLTGSR